MNSRLLLIIGLFILALLFLTLGAGVLAWQSPGDAFEIFAIEFQ